ncbi:type III restriction enzyme [Macrolepiota fuliginosa MF-IS2]|uniref:Type III restriction enzyme n=1 Tax=Macrolepiota fuliginosa MF-IS2 TaxID=1400762 RepID=A0A9P5XNF1_9AGAR|nr:type III restriction enzyme [Macrolepiota fuliginosa MF-IS2]
MAITDSDASTTRDLRPRKYQEEIFQRAQKENVIAALSTGSGKTLIGLLLIKWISALEKSRDKLIIFLVPRVTLVEQQAKYLSDNTPLRISKLYGALDVDLSDRIRWRRRLDLCDVIVMTPQILVNLITHSLWSLQRVSLLVFDECHHTRKNHPYNIIMREYFHIRIAEQRPRIFGMTASPVWNTKDPVGSLLALEANMGSVIISVREHVEELAAHAPRPAEVIKIYPIPPETYSSHEPNLFQCLSVVPLTIWDRLEVPWSNVAMRHDMTLYNLGPYCASLYLFLEIWHALKRMPPGLHAPDSMEIETAEFIPASGAPRKTPPEGMSLIRDILSDFEGFFWDPVDPNTVPVPVPAAWCTPKLNALRDVLLEFYTTKFQVIIFVEQRQVASCLSKVLSAIPELKDKIRSAHLVGQGVNSEGVSKTTDMYHGDAVQAFRKGEVNVLIATSVAEEGLDFPACDLVVRFDPFRHMVGYVQSRGRARNAASRFVVMIREDDQDGFNLYQSLQAQEPEMNKVYQARQRLQAAPAIQEDDEDEEDDLDPSDLAGRERYVVPSTGAILTYDNAIGLLSYLCALIPCDPYTPIHKPKFVEDFQTTVRLPLSIPLPPEQLTYTGPFKYSKKEAKRAVAFMAVKCLHGLDVFDDYLLPTPGKTLGEEEITHARHALEPQNTSVTLNVDVKFPWTMGDRLWLHPVYIKGDPVAGLITGVPLPFVELQSDVLLRLGRPQALIPGEEEREAMCEYTKLGIFYRITGSPWVNRLGVFLVPLKDDLEIDIDKVRGVVNNPRGFMDWKGIDEDHYGRLLVLNRWEHGRTRILQRIRDDLSPMSTPPVGSREATAPTYHKYWTDKWIRGKLWLEVPSDGPLLEASRIVKHATGRYSLDPDYRIPGISPDTSVSSVVPMRCCGWVDMSPEMCRGFELLPALCRKITDTYRAQSARMYIGLPLIPDDLLIEALTLPSVGADFSNQRLETLGDAVLDICTTVHLMIKYPRRHEGQLTLLRQRVISNRFLVSCARTVGLEKLISSERSGVTKWPYVEQEDYYDKEVRERKTVQRQIPRRGLQDCVEALLGASFIAGGIPMALRTGVALGLSFGGLEPWRERDEMRVGGTEMPALVVSLQKELGYTFENSLLLVEAVTHPSFEFSMTPSYQRLEFLGDSVIKMAVTIYLFHKFPKATSHQLALPRTKAICAPALASLGIRKLNIHKYLLYNSIDLGHAINLYLPILQSTTAEEIVRRGWRYDPPKALSDAFESVVGAIFVDSGYDLDRTVGIVGWLMEDVLEALSPSIPKDPVSELLEWLPTVGCGHGNMKFRKAAEPKDGAAAEGVSAVFHGVVIVGPIMSNSKNVARFAAAEKALVALRDINEGELLKKLCNCKQRMAVDEEKAGSGVDQRSDDEDGALNEEEEKEVIEMLIEQEDFE